MSSLRSPRARSPLGSPTSSLPPSRTTSAASLHRSIPGTPPSRGMSRGPSGTNSANGSASSLHSPTASAHFASPLLGPSRLYPGRPLPPGRSMSTSPGPSRDPSAGYMNGAAAAPGLPASDHPPPPRMTRDPSPTPSSAAAGRHENVSVAVRMRPLTDSEAASGGSVAWEIDEADAQVIRCVADRQRRLPAVPGAPTSATMPEFAFDHVYEGSNNALLYSEAVKTLVYSTMEGFNGTVFAYGQTSSGKTYTMMGTDSEPGVIPQAVHDVFQYIKLSEGRREFLLRVSYLEIYNESIRDLLAPDTRDLRIHEDRKRGVYVSPLKEEIVTNPTQVMKVIARGEANRHVSTTDYNEHSSRSHTLFQMVIESRESAVNGQGQARSGKTVKISSLNLIDLAGSEKAATNVDRRKEGSYINRSLLTLGSVIAKLTEERATHIPYRDSKLTRILQSSLSGNARVTVVCTISPSSNNLEESTNTLKFAARVKQVVTRAHTNHVMDDKALLQKYRKEISELKEKLMMTNQAFERERQLELMQIKAEKEKYEEELHEQHLLRTALKERIDHLTRLILTSGSISQVQMGPPPPSGPVIPGATPAAAALPAARVDALNSELVAKDLEINRLNTVIKEQREQLANYLRLTTALQDGDTAAAIAMARDVEGSLVGSVESLVDINAEIVDLKQRNRELDIVVADAEERYQLLLQDYTRDREGWAAERMALEDEVRALKASVADVRHQLRKAEVEAFVALETQSALDDARERLAAEQRARRDEHERYMNKVSSLESELTLTKAELSIARLSSTATK
ncbi:Kinesin-like protein kip2 [Blastocladiella emersonii ATCC 22665]|nr:Kinesin-like protein kip2 [Blastocladiella emersonii ATCC 22665]